MSDQITPFAEIERLRAELEAALVAAACPLCYDVATHCGAGCDDCDHTGRADMAAAGLEAERDRLEGLFQKTAGMMRRLRAGELEVEELPADVRTRRYDEIRRAIDGRRRG